MLSMTQLRVWLAPAGTTVSFGDIRNCWTWDRWDTWDSAGDTRRGANNSISKEWTIVHYKHVFHWWGFILDCDDLWVNQGAIITLSGQFNTNKLRARHHPRQPRCGAGAGWVRYYNVGRGCDASTVRETLCIISDDWISSEASWSDLGNATQNDKSM